jgi:hypothetical protein
MATFLQVLQWLWLILMIVYFFVRTQGELTRWRKEKADRQREKVRDKEPVEVWVCCRNIADAAEGTVWDFQGIFSTEGRAILACQAENYFVGPAKMGVELPPEQVEWEGCYYPLLLMSDVLQSMKPGEV